METLRVLASAELANTTTTLSLNRVKEFDWADNKVMTDTLWECSIFCVTDIFVVYNFFFRTQFLKAFLISLKVLSRADCVAPAAIRLYTLD